jgi:hypothetical protein
MAGLSFFSGWAGITLCQPTEGVEMIIRARRKAMAVISLPVFLIIVGACSRQTAAVQPVLKCVDGLSFEAIPVSPDSGSKGGLGVGQWIDSVPFGAGPEWQVTGQWDLNRDGRLESVIAFAEAGDFGTESAILSPCGETSVTAIAGPVKTHGWHPLVPESGKASEAPPFQDEYLKSGWHSLQSPAWKTWMPLLEWASIPQSTEDDSESCEDVKMIRSDFGSGQYRPKYEVNCSCRTRKCDGVQTLK